MLPAGLAQPLLAPPRAGAAPSRAGPRRGRGASSCPMPLASSTRTPPATGPGNGSSRRRAPTATPAPAGGAATTSTRRSSSGRSTTPCAAAGISEARLLPHAAPFLRDPSARGRLRHPHDPGAAGPLRREHHDDLHPRPEPRRPRRREPAQCLLDPGDLGGTPANQLDHAGAPVTGNDPDSATPNSLSPAIRRPPRRRTDEEQPLAPSLPRSLLALYSIPRRFNWSSRNSLLSVELNRYAVELP